MTENVTEQKGWGAINSTIEQMQEMRKEHNDALKKAEVVNRIVTGKHLYFSLLLLCIER